jgi:hypothetical protein
MSPLRLTLGAVIASALTLAAPSAHAQAASDTAAEDRWVEGNLVFLAYHEVGHLLLDQVMRINQSANRLAAEQSADDIATWLIAPDPDEQPESSEAVAAIEGWLESDAQDASGPSRAPDAQFYPDAQTRAARIACLLIGSDTSNPNAFEALRPIADLQFNSATCRRDFEALDQRLEAVFGDSDLIKANPVARVDVRYDDADPALAEARDFLIASRVLDDLKDDLVNAIGLPVNVVLRGASCGQGSPGFIYSPARREITACYEEVDWFLFGDPESGTPSAQRQAERGDMGARPRRIAPLQRPAPPPPPPR